MKLTAEKWTFQTSELAALARFTSDDPTRPYLHGLGVDMTRGRVAATNGVRLLTWCGDKCGARILLLDGDGVRALVAAVGKEEREICVEWQAEWAECRLPGCLIRINYRDCQLPPVEQVLPDKARAAGSPPWFDVHLLDDLRETLGEGFGPDGWRGTKLHWGPGELDPIWVELGDDAWTCVVMPMRRT